MEIIIYNMNYQKIKLLGGAVVSVDLDANRTKCKKCGEMIRFGITASGKYMPIIQIGENYQSHFVDCKFADSFRKTKMENNIDEENKNQEFLNNL